MRISIAMCTYNGARYLQEMLDSFAIQTHRPFELIVCDDGSTDSTLSILQSFRDRGVIPVSIFRNAINLGYSRNFAKAIQSCNGDVIALADQDDIWYSRKLERLAEIFSADPSIEGAFSNGDLLDEASQPIGRTLWESFLFGTGDQARLNSGAAFDVLLRRNVVTGMALAFRSSATDISSAIPDSWSHDAWIAMQIAIRSRLVAVPQCLVGYRVHGTQQIGTPPPISEKLLLFRQEGLLSYLERTHALNVNDYQSMASQFDDLLKWAQASHQDHALNLKVHKKAMHAHRGSKALSLRRLSRIPLLTPHIRDYVRFSPNGVLGLLRDLVV